jgi:NADH-quinone oxidoreductase subunit L
MITHAFFKALLFLGAGSVIHGMHDEQDMKKMGALRKLLPVTSFTFIIGWLAIAGVPPFSGFWSKDDILLNAFEKSPILWAVGLLTALLTAYYMSRQVFLVFYGTERWKHAADPETPAEAVAEPEHEPAAAKSEPAGAKSDPAGAHGAHGDFKPHESPRVMLIPLVVLAVGAAFGGLLNLPFKGWDFLEHWLEPVFGEHIHHISSGAATKLALVAITAPAVVIGIAIAYYVVLKGRIRESTVEPKVLRRGWYVDELYQKVIVAPGTALSNWLSYFFDAKVIDGLVNGVATLVRSGGTRLRTVQSGFVRNYALAVAIGAVAMLAFAVSRSL